MSVFRHRQHQSRSKSGCESAPRWQPWRSPEKARELHDLAGRRAGLHLDRIYLHCDNELSRFFWGAHCGAGHTVSFLGGEHLAHAQRAGMPDRTEVRIWWQFRTSTNLVGLSPIVDRPRPNQSADATRRSGRRLPAQAGPMQHSWIPARVEVGIGSVQQAPIIPHQHVTGAPPV